MHKKIKILYHIPNPNSTGADRWIFEGWQDAYLDMGLGFDTFTDYDDIKSKVEEFKPDIFWTAYNIFDLVSREADLKWIRSRGCRVFMQIDWPRTKAEIEVVKNQDIADIYCSEREQKSMVEFEKTTGRTYYTVPNAANKLFHYPGNFTAKYDYDIVYLGAKLPMKKWFFDEVLLPLTKKYKVGIFGPYWTLKDNILRASSKLCSKVKFRYGMDLLNSRRIIIPADEENLLYSSAKISLNFHEREADGSQPHYILNQRTFKIPACGGFQICDEIPAICSYFKEDELVTAAYDPKDWFDKIEYYINDEKARKAIQKKGTERALKDHTYHNRVRQIIKFYSQCQ